MIAISGLGLLTPFSSHLEDFEKFLEPSPEPSPVLTLPQKNSKILEIPLSSPASLTRRWTHLTKLTMAATSLALTDYKSKAISPLALENSEGKGIVLGGVHGSLQSCETLHQVLLSSPHLVSPALFSEGGLNAGVSHISMLYGFQGSLTSLSGDESVGNSAVVMAYEQLEYSDHQFFLAGGVHENSPLLEQVYHRLSPQLMLSEGAVLLALERCSSSTISPPYAFIWGGQNFTAEVQAQRIEEKITSFLETQDLSPQAIDLVVTNKNRTSKDQEMERVLQQLFPQSLSLHPVLALGEAFACSSALQVALGSLFLRKKKKDFALIFSYGIRGNGSLLLLSSKKERR
jgi:hypothetical protein